MHLIDIIRLLHYHNTWIYHTFKCPSGERDGSVWSADRCVFAGLIDETRRTDTGILQAAVGMIFVRAGIAEDGVKCRNSVVGIFIEVER